MLAINAIDYYSKIINELDSLSNSIEFMKENSLVVESKSILGGFLNSKISSNSADYVYTIGKKNSSDSEVLISNYLKQFSVFKTNFKITKFSGLLTLANNNINIVFSRFGYCDECIVDLMLDLGQVAQLYEEVITSNDSKIKIVEFFDKMQECVVEYDTVMKGLKSYIEVIGSTYNEDSISTDNTMELQLLDVEYSVGKFGELLLNLDNAYSSLVPVFSKELSIKTLKIVKIESGSLLSKILGDNNILEVLALILKRVSDYVHNNFTRVGRLEVNSSVMKEISNDAEIIKKLEDAGINVKKAKTNIENAVNAATMELYKIASSAPRLKINDEEIRIADKQVYLEYKTQLLDKPETIDKEANESPSEN